MNQKINRKTRNLKTNMLWMILMLIFIMELLTYTWCRVQFVGKGYELSEAAQEQKRLLLLRSNLRIEVAHLKSPQRITRIAKERLGLGEPRPDQLIVIP